MKEDNMTNQYKIALYQRREKTEKCVAAFVRIIASSTRANWECAMHEKIVEDSIPLLTAIRVH